MKMKKTLLVTFVLLVAIGLFILDTLRDAGEFKTIQPHFSGEIQKVFGVTGAEDITIHPQTGVAFISGDDRRANRRGESKPGAIYKYPLKAERPELTNLTPNVPFEFHPHGISLFLGDGEERLFVVNHRAAGDFIEIFAIRNDSLFHSESIRGDLMHSPNDVVAVAARTFYVTNDHGSRSNFGRTLEEYLRLAKSHVLYFDGQNFKRVTAGLLYANGINKSPDGRTIYAAAVTAGKIHVYNRDAASGALAPRTQIELGTGVDNIEVDSAGNIWAAAHPKLLTFVKYSKDGSHLSPSQVLKITLAGEKDFQVTEIFLDDGKWLSGASVGAAFESSLLIGPVFDDHFLVCKFAN